ncbi:putative zinc-type alcohol dehydrogenase-like protein [Hapsidospora chrysogenum ATCC 11550]|uniref:Putative zinc-type alcohol dehydrogenase-like protein n=1 Tax=Hapsidospora chrysogenum (strain ATCC 11550 / CBS 779.69 / DSM 880 / IAM 14645 / JCM 23072 / IMI 49137) TaxID=857340 RepID=A0A086SW52_HAPC1|nr:putative zinc-type alcohol dehydrogenase-like protein [Hapsidospora chrysogenum ATCC 11550]
MKAIVISTPGSVENLVIRDDIPRPTPTRGTALIKIPAFGINHAEMHMRRGEWAESVPISGIECVGVVEDCPGGEIPARTPVAALMGGLGRTVPGSYAEYTVARVSNVVALADTEEELPLPWAEIAALPESYATAWACLFRNLGLRSGQRLLIRGRRLNLAVEAGAIITATTRSEAKFGMLRGLGVTDVIRECPSLAQRLKDQHPEDAKFDCILELVGNSTVVESLTMMASGVHFSFFGSFVFGTDEFPLSDVPLREIVQKVADGRVKHAKPWTTFGFGEIREAHKVMEEGGAGGKMVVVVDSGGRLAPACL